MKNLIRVLCGLGIGGLSFPGVGAEVRPEDWDRTVQPFLAKHCVSCHGAEKKKGGLDLEPLRANADVMPHREAWEKVRHAIASREMPPEKETQPGEADRLAVSEWIEASLEKADASLPPRPGAVTSRRLNRNEYRNTVRDLTGIDFEVHEAFPTDESGYGFDNIGAVLSLPPMLMEKYLAAAEEIAGRVIETVDPAERRVQRIPAGRFTSRGDAVSTVEEEVWGFFREGEILTDHEVKEAGEYGLRLTTYGEQAGPELPRLGVSVDGKSVHTHSVRAQADRPEVVEVRVRLDAGKHRLGVSYLNNFNSDGDRNLYLTSFAVVGPLGAAPEAYSEAHRRVLPRRPEPGQERAWAKEVLQRFASRAFRRPTTEREVDRLVSLVEGALRDGESFERGIQLGVTAVLVSPAFLFRWELDPEPLDPGAIRGLGDYEIASRLSYFLWSSMPDDELFAAAARGDLARIEGRKAQVLRMLKDAKAQALVRNFGGQWLQIRNLDESEPDPSVFPTWNGSLREAMRTEAELFVSEIVREDRSIRDLVDANFTYLNETLAKHYGIPDVSGPEFRRVLLPEGSPRGGILTLGSVLTVTSVPTRTAPVLRGKWILEQILGTPPPPPPPNVPPIEEGAAASKTASLRQRLELHRSKPDCMVCHQKMDPLGFALENFDGIGAWRLNDGPHPVDNQAELPGGRKIEGALGLKQVVARSEEFPRALTTKLLTYALGRGLEGYDRREVRRIVAAAAKNDFKFSSLVLEIVDSDPFLKRQPQYAHDSKHARVDR
ncbi:MAG: DUF1592 domain-containing protein [Verrucomicrobiales bacterium]|nr:DUF1592 domain-containing protein [Verrucomicrobiales bacterium]